MFEFPLRFPGQYADKETNLHYNYFRDFDPILGIYKQSDPIGLRGGLKYVRLRRWSAAHAVDPYGLKPSYREADKRDRGRVWPCRHAGRSVW